VVLLQRPDDGSSARWKAKELAKVGYRPDGNITRTGILVRLFFVYLLRDLSHHYARLLILRS
jgi:hypothetical protein